MFRRLIPGFMMLCLASSMMGARPPAKKDKEKKIAPIPASATALPASATPIPELPAISPGSKSGQVPQTAGESGNPALSEPAGPPSQAGEKAATPPVVQQAATPGAAPSATPGATGELSQELTGMLQAAAQYVKGNQFREAIALYSEVLAARKDMFSPYMDRGKAYQALKEYDKAIADYGAALKIKPDLMEAYSRRCTLFFESKAYAQAIPDCGVVIQSKPRTHEPFYFKGMAHAALREYDRAIETLNQAFEINNDLPDAHLLLGKIYLDTDQLLSALREYTVVLQQRPNHSEALKTRASIRVKLGDDAGAKDDLSKLKP